MIELILAIDIGTSSIRCSAYEFIHPLSSSLIIDAEYNPDVDEDDSTCLYSNVQYIPGSLSSINISWIEPNSGKINVFPKQQEQQQQNQQEEVNPSILDMIDTCMDKTIHFLRHYYNNHYNNNHASLFQIMAIGFSSFVMNLIGVDKTGNMIHPNATCSYACNTKQVQQECQDIQRFLGPIRLQRLYHKTGTPIHSSYALPQLLYYYKQLQKEEEEDKDNGITTPSLTAPLIPSPPPPPRGGGVYRWLSISSLCIARWMNQKEKDIISNIPISYSEASWTGMFNYTTCTWEEEILNLLPKECQDALPRVVDSFSSFHHHHHEKKKNHYSYSYTFHPQPQWPELTSSCQVFLGFGDGICATMGSKCTIPQRIAVTIGTSAAVRICIPYNNNPKKELLFVSSLFHQQDEYEKPKIKEDPFKDTNDELLLFDNIHQIFPPPGLFCYRIHSNLLLVGGAISDGGSIIEWIRTLFNLTTDESFATCLEQVKNLYQQKSKQRFEIPLDVQQQQNYYDHDRRRENMIQSTHSFHIKQENNHSSSSNNTSMIETISPPILFVPFLSGERSTGFRPGATGSFIGLTRHTSQQDFVLSSMEGVILRLATILKLMEPIQTTNNNCSSSSSSTQSMIIVSGTALDRNELWRQMLSDCTQKIVVMDTDCMEGSSRGVAILLAQALVRNRSKSETQGMNIIERLDLSNCQVSQYDAETHSYWSKLSVLQENAITHIAPLWESK